MYTVMDAEMLGIARVWEEGYKTVALDSHAAIRSCLKLVAGIQRAESCIDGRMLEGGGWQLIWVQRHSGVEDNERADARAKMTTRVGRLALEPCLVTPAGIRQLYPTARRRPTVRVGQKRPPGTNVPTHGQGTDERVAAPGRESPGPVV